MSSRSILGDVCIFSKRGEELDIKTIGNCCAFLVLLLCGGKLYSVGLSIKSDSPFLP